MKRVQAAMWDQLSKHQQKLELEIRDKVIKNNLKLGRRIKKIPIKKRRCWC